MCMSLNVSGVLSEGPVQEQPKPTLIPKGEA